MPYLNLFTHFYCGQYENSNNTINDYSAAPRPFHNLFLLETGKAALMVQNKTIFLNQGDFCYIPKGCCYLSRWYGAHLVRLKTVHFVFCPENDPLKNRQTALLPLATQGLPVSRCMNEIFKAQKNPRLFARVLADFFALFQCCYSKLPPAGPQKLPGRTAPAVDYLKMFFLQPISVRLLADRCYLSESRFYSCFKTENGCSPIAFKNKLMIEHAICLMAEQPHRSLEQIAASSGFSGTVYFRRQFKKITGLTPGEYLRHKNGI